MDLKNATVNTAGAYICLDGIYPFAIGARPYHGRIPVVRLGGHREENETGWQCAVREAREEADLQIMPIVPRMTYLADGDHIEAGLHETQWQGTDEYECNPILIVAYRRDGGTVLSLMYLARAEGYPVPSSEVKGLLLLDEQTIHRLCREPLTLEGYLNMGGKAILKHDFDTRLVLEPFAQLRCLSRILSMQSEACKNG